MCACAAAGKAEKITITNDKGRLSQEDIERMVQEAEEFAEADKAVRKPVLARPPVPSLFLAGVPCAMHPLHFLRGPPPCVCCHGAGRALSLHGAGSELSPQEGMPCAATGRAQLARVLPCAAGTLLQDSLQVDHCVLGAVGASS